MKSRSLILLVALCFVAWVVPCVTAAGLQKVGTLSNGPSFDLVESNGYLYAGQGMEVVTYDVSTSSKMSALTWKSALTQLPVGSAIKSVSVDSGYLYIAAESKFVIADISKPASPAIVSTLSNGGSDVLIKGTYAYLLSGGSGVTVIDISNKAAPKIVTTVKLAGKNSPWRGTIDGNYLYVGLETDNRLDILDISIPSTPRVVGSYSPNIPGVNHVSGVAVKGGYAFITEYYNGVRVIDVSNPAQPREVMNQMGINANDIKILGNYAYVSVRYQGFDIFDISNPRSIVVVGKATNAAYYNEGIYPTKNYTFISLESLGFGIYDTSVIATPKSLARVQVVGGDDSVIMRGSYLYIGAHNEGIWTVDVSNPAKPKELSFISNLGRNGAMDLVGNNLYVAGTWSGLSVIDVTNAANPVMVLYHFDTRAVAVVADGNYVYTEQGIVDMTNLKSPVYISTSPYFAGSATKYGNNYLVVASGDGLHILDVSNKKNPVLVTTFDTNVSYQDVKIHGNIAVAATGNTISTIDLSNPKAPKRLSQLSYPAVWYANVLALHDTIVYAAGRGTNNVRAFDISDPAQIRLVDSIDLGGNFGTISYDNGYLAVGGKMATYILSTSLIPSPPPVITTTPKITLTSPNGGETLKRGTTQTVTWSYAGNAGSTVKLVLLKGSTEVGTIVDSTSIGSGGKGSYSWPLSSSGAGGTGSDYKVSIESISLPTIKDVSNSYFTIAPGTTTPTITVTSPNGGETLKRGTTQTVTWSYTGSAGSTVKLVLLKGSTEVGTIVDSTSIGSGGKGSYSWPLSISGSGGTGSDYKVSIESVSQPTIKDTSNSYFTIAPGTTTPTITVTSPNGGETLKRGTTRSITWSYAGSAGSTVKLVLLKGSTEVGTIVDSTSIGSGGKGSYSWALSLSGSGGTGSDYKVSIQSISQPTIRDASNSYFKITS